MLPFTDYYENIIYITSIYRLKELGFAFYSILLSPIHPIQIFLGPIINRYSLLRLCYLLLLFIPRTIERFSLLNLRTILLLLVLLILRATIS